MNESKVEVIFGHDCNVSTAYTTHADYRALEEQSAYFRKEWNKAEEKIASLEEELTSIKARVADYERAVTEQAMLTECVSVTGRDPSDVIRDVIHWHVSNAAQPVAAGDNWPYGVGIYGPANMPAPQPVYALIPEEAQGCDPRAKTSYRYGYQHGLKAAREYAALAGERLTVPEGYRLVPVEPTEAMAIAAAKSVSGEWDDESADVKIGLVDLQLAAIRDAIAAAPDGEVG